MKTVVITGSSRGFGFEMAKQFRRNDFNVVISGKSEENLKKAQEALQKIKSEAGVFSVPCDVTNSADLQVLADEAVKRFGAIDIWINNAGVNQQMVPVWEVDDETIEGIIDTDLKSAVTGSKIALKQMMRQGYGQIYGVEGYGSNDAMMTGLSVYGAGKRGLTYFLQALSKEVKDKEIPVQIGLLSPGIMITDFLTHSMGNQGFELPEGTKKVCNILGDYPDVIAKFMVKKILANKKNGRRITWLTNRKSFIRFLTSPFKKRDFFSETQIG